MKKTRFLPDEVKVVLEAIRNDVLQLHGRWQAFNEIYANSDSVALINETAPRFFAFVYEAALNELISAVTRKTDSQRVAGKETLGFEQLAHLLGKYGFRLLRKRISSRVKKIRPNSKKDFVARRDPITYSRHKRVAHTDLQIRIDRKSKPLPDLRIDKFEKALKLFREMLDITDAAFGIHSPRYEDLSLDSGRLLVSLKLAKDASDSPYCGEIIQKVQHPSP